MQRLDSLRTSAKLLALWLSFSLALLINRGPIFFPDTTAYFRIADAAVVSLGAKPSEWSDRLPNTWIATDPTHVGDKTRSASASARPTPLAGRSIYYGAALLILGPALAALLQSLVAAGAVLVAANRLSPNMPFITLPFAIGLSSAPIFAALLMPDLLAALAVLACAMILPDWHKMGRLEKVFWFCLLVAGVLSHSATLLIVTAVLIMSMLWRTGRGQKAPWPLIIALAGGLLGEICFALAVSHATGSQPLRPPFLSARLVADGPGRIFLQRDCARKRRFHQCDFYRRLPANSDAILWGQDGAGFISMPTAVQRAWSAEDTK